MNIQLRSSKLERRGLNIEACKHDHPNIDTEQHRKLSRRQRYGSLSILVNDGAFIVE